MLARGPARLFASLLAHATPYCTCLTSRSQLVSERRFSYLSRKLGLLGRRWENTYVSASNSPLPDPHLDALLAEAGWVLKLAKRLARDQAAAEDDDEMGRWMWWTLDVVDAGCGGRWMWWALDVVGTVG